MWSWRSAARPTPPSPADPDNIGAHRNLVALLTDGGERSEAIAVLRQAVALDPTFAEGHSRLGGLLKQDDELDAALQSIQHALEIDPELAEAHNELGNVLLEAVRIAEPCRGIPMPSR